MEQEEPELAVKLTWREQVLNAGNFMLEDKSLGALELLVSQMKAKTITLEDCKNALEVHAEKYSTFLCYEDLQAGTPDCSEGYSDPSARRGGHSTPGYRRRIA